MTVVTHVGDTVQEQLEDVASKLKKARELEDALKSARLELIYKARKEGMTYQEIGNILGVTKAYVYQQVKAQNVAEANAAKYAKINP